MQSAMTRLQGNAPQSSSQGNMGGLLEKLRGRYERGQSHTMPDGGTMAGSMRPAPQGGMGGLGQGLAGIYGAMQNRFGEQGQPPSGMQSPLPSAPVQPSTMAPSGMSFQEQSGGRRDPSRLQAMVSGLRRPSSGMGSGSY